MRLEHHIVGGYVRYINPHIIIIIIIIIIIMADNRVTSKLKKLINTYCNLTKSLIYICESYSIKIYHWGKQRIDTCITYNWA